MTAGERLPPKRVNAALVRTILTAGSLDHLYHAVLVSCLATAGADWAMLELEPQRANAGQRTLWRHEAMPSELHGCPERCHCPRVGCAGGDRPLLAALAACQRTASAVVVEHGEHLATLEVGWLDAANATAHHRRNLQRLAAGLPATAVLLQFRAESERRVRAAAILAETTAAMATAADLDGSLRALIAGMQALTGAEKGGVRLLDDPANVLGSSRLYFWRGSDDYIWLSLATTSGVNTLQVMRHGRAEYTRDLRDLMASNEMVRLTTQRDHILSSLIVPLRAAGQVVGTLHADASRPHFFRDDQLQPLQLLADNAGGAVEQARLRAAEREQARAREAAEITLRESEARYRSLVEISPDLIAVHQDGIVSFVNPAGARLCAASNDQMLIGRRVDDLVLYAGVAAEDLEPAGTGTSQPADQFAEGILRRLDGGLTPVEVTSRPLMYDGIPARLTIARDVTERKALEARLMHQATHDALTGLPNRALFADRLSHALARSARSATGVAILYLDIDRFKVVNDSLGHAAGDALLIAVSRRITSCLRSADTLARRGGDEFAVLLEDCNTQEAALLVAERLLKAVEPPFLLKSHEVAVTLSIGVVLSASAQQNAEHLLQDADLAMYRAKARGRGRYELYSGDLLTEARARLDLEAELRQAITAGQFCLHYQPIVNLTTGEIRSFEALVRWQHPTRGLLMPASFLSVAQETGLIALIDRWAIEEGCHELQRWHSAHAQRRPLMLCLNLSAQLFHQTALVNEIRNLLVRTQVPAGSLVLEIIEGTVIEATDVTIAIMHHLKALGVRLLIDDFGVGYSSLSYLKRFPVEGLKIDGSFVEGMTTGSVDMAIVNSVVSLAHALDLRVVAEGIETLDQWALLRDVHCDFGQGYLFDAPLTAAEVNDLLRGGASAYGATAAALQAQHPALPPVPSEPLVAS